jgi:hypothetical protein
MSASTRSRRRAAFGLIAIATALALLPLQAVLGLAGAGTANASAQLTFAPPVPYQVGASPATVTTADLNGDGFPDLVVGTTQGVATLLNNGDGTFAHFTPYPTGGVPSFCYGSCVVAANLSENSLPDIAFTRSGGGFGVLLNNGDGTFKAPVFYSSGSGLTIPTSIAVGDLFHDGHQDLALVEVGSFGSSPTLTIFRDQGNGTFTKVLQQGLVDGAVEVTIADLNNDGYPDLTTANGNTNGNRTISVYMNLKNGTFAPPVNYVTDGARFVVAADVNNNGLLDLVFPLTQSQGFEVMLNNGDGTFSPPVVFRTPGVWVASLQAADMYGTGRLDLIGNNGGIGTFVIQNNGNTSFGTPVTVTDGANSAGPVIAADVDGNGDNDLVATDTGSTSVDVLLSQRLPFVDHGLRLSTYHGGNAGTVTLTIFGTGIPAGSTSELVCSGQSTLAGANPVVSPSGTALTATFNLVGATPGQCTAVVVKPDGSTATAAKPFTIDQGGEAQPWVQVFGWSSLRAGRPQTFFLVYGNRGNVDATYVPILLQFSSLLTYAVSEHDAAIITPSQGPDQTLLTSDVVTVPAGSSGVIPFTITGPSDPQLAHHVFQLEAWTFNVPDAVTSSVLTTATVQSAAVSWTSWRQALNDIWHYLAGVSSYSLPAAGDFIAGVGADLDDLGLCGVIDAVGWVSERIYLDDVTQEIAADSDPRYVELHEHVFPRLENAAVSRGLRCSTPIGVTSSASTELITPGDPNAIVGPAGVGTAQYISGSLPLGYAIFFSNEQTASASAQTVVITDQLDPTKDDLKTFALGPIAFGGQLLTPPPGSTDYVTTVDLRPANNLLVQVNAHLDLGTGLLTWRFTSLDPATQQPPADPSAGFLSPGAEGSVFYTVLPKVGLPTGTQVQNQATIVFDANAPMSTQTWVNTLDNDLPTSHVLSLPATETSNTFPVQWAGTDVGAGTQDFTIFVSENGGPFTVWQADTTATSAIFSGKFSSTYSFYSVARDLVGNVEAAKTAAEATTTVGHSTALAYTGAITGDYDDAVTLAATLTDTSASPASGVSGVPVTLSLGTQSCTGTTDNTGTATCSVTLNQTPGKVTVSASFSGNSTYLPSSTTPALFTIGTEETALTIASPSALAVNAVSVSARLLEDGRTVPNPGGQTVTFTATPSNGGSPVTGTATIDATGTATTTLALPPGSYSLTASFGGDGFYQPATAGPQTLYVYQPTTFVIWGGNLPIPAGQSANVTVGQDYTFWGAQWASQVKSGNFQANPSFKGFATSVSGSTWTSTPGASSGPPATVASYISVIVTTSATKNGSVESGNVTEIVVLKVDNPGGYQPNPGSQGSGILVAVVR